MLTKLEHISEETVQRYSERYKKLGYDVQTLGWGTKEQQEYRFFQTLDPNIDFDNKTVLDIGCGFGDYYSFLKRANVPIARYVGWDINPDLINEAEKLHNADKNATFGVKNIIESAEDTSSVADIGVILGVLNFNLKDKFDNYDYSKLVIQKAFCLVKDVLIVDFLSSYRTESYPKEDFVFYHEPEKMLEYAFSLSDNVILKHNYAPIPQKEIMLFIYR